MSKSPSLLEKCTRTLYAGYFTFNLDALFGNSTSTGAGSGAHDIADRALKLLLAFAYPIAFIGIVYTAYQLITSAGKPEPYAAAKKNLTYLVTGIFIITFAAVIVRFFINIFGNH
jgi:formate/nitrite transporter FocA (FNT family)